MNLPSDEVGYSVTDFAGIPGMDNREARSGQKRLAYGQAGMLTLQIPANAEKNGNVRCLSKRVVNR